MTPNQQINRINNVMRELNVDVDITEGKGSDSQSIISFFSHSDNHFMEIRTGGIYKGFSCHHYKKGHGVSFCPIAVKKMNRIYLFIVELIADNNLQYLSSKDGILVGG